MGRGKKGSNEDYIFAYKQTMALKSMQPDERKALAIKLND